MDIRDKRRERKGEGRKMEGKKREKEKEKGDFTSHKDILPPPLQASFDSKLLTLVT